MAEQLTPRDGRVGTAGVSRLEAVLWAAVAALLMLWNSAPGFIADVENDGTAYLSVAENALAGRLAETSIVHFDAERSFGRIPAPLVTFPAGFGLLTALAAAPGVQLERAALIVSMLAMCVSTLLLAALARTMGLSVLATRIVLVAFVANWTTLEYGVAAASEPAFSCSVLAFCLLLLRSLEPGLSRGRSLTLAIAAGVLLGASYWIRYAGLFFGVGLAVLAAVYLLTGRRKQFGLTVTAGAVAAAIMAVGLLRNTLLVGSWRGGNTMEYANPFLAIAQRTIANIDDLLFASIPFRETLPWRAAFLLLAGVACWQAVAAVRKRRAEAPAALHAARRWPRGAMELGVLAATYAIVIFYAAMTTVISYDTRMYVPIVGPLLLTLAATIQWYMGDTALRESRRTTAFAALCGMAAIYAFMHLTFVARTQANTYPAVIAGILDLRGSANETPRTAVAKLLSGGGRLLANDGQMTAYTLGQPTVSLVERRYTETDWNEAAVLELARRYDARALVLRLPGPRDDRTFLLPSKFLERLADGNEPVPAWLIPVQRHRSVVVYAVSASRPAASAVSATVSPVPAS